MYIIHNSNKIWIKNVGARIKNEYVIKAKGTLRPPHCLLPLFSLDLSQSIFSFCFGLSLANEVKFSCIFFMNLNKGNAYLCKLYVKRNPSRLASLFKEKLNLIGNSQFSKRLVLNKILRNQFCKMFSNVDRIFFRKTW